MIALLITGAAVFCAGILVVIFGMPIKEFSFGHTLILVGAIVACTGLLLMGLYLIGRELRNLSRRLGAGQKTETKKVATDRTTVRDAVNVPSVERAKNVPESPRTSPPTWLSEGEDFLFPNNQPPDHAEDMTYDLPPPSGSKAWQDQEHAPPQWLVDAPADVSPRIAEKPRRSFLFSSKRRETPSSHEFQEGHSADRSPSFDTDTDNAAGNWSNSERERDRPFSRNNRSFENAVRDTSVAGLERYRSPRRAEAEPVTIVKSGVVDSMAYSLYSDGSIEAQMPEGVVRFASVDELRAHLDQRGG
jgi:hypothetical protein